MAVRILLVMIILAGLGWLVFLLSAETHTHRRADSSVLAPGGGRGGVLSMPTTFPSDLPVPAPGLSPAEVVRVIISSLRDNDLPSAECGVATTFNFASPANRAMTGPLPRFILLVHNEVYAPLINHKRAEFDALRTVGDQAQQLVTVYDSAGAPAHFVFQLSRQTEGVEAGCWMTEGVIRLSTEQAKELRVKFADPNM